MKDLSFHNTQFDIIERDGQPWLQAAQIAEALGYSREDAVSRIYSRNKDEFAPNMTLTVNLTVKGFGGGNGEKEVRIFSLRGAHLIAMFARTKVAKEFRKWVLDVLDDVVQSGAYIIQDTRPGLTLAQQDELRSKLQWMTGIAGLSDQSGQWVCNHLRVVFKVRQIADIPAEHFGLVLQIVESKRDAVFQFASALRETRKWFEKEVLAGGTPWTPDVKAKLTRKLQRQVILPPRVDWLALEQETQQPKK